METQTDIQNFLKKENVFELPKTFSAIITDIVKIKASEVFGDKAKEPNQEILKVSFENDQYKIKGHDVFNVPEDLEKIKAMSNLGKAIKFYDGLQIGKEITIVNGDFLKILY